MSISAQAWKSKKFGVPMMEGRVASISKVKRWDGAARSCSDWDNLRRDPELWFRGGNCFVHLYGKGQSRRGPAFKVPFGALLSAKCHPFVKKFMSRDVPEMPELFSDPFEDLDRWNALNPHEKIELYIPAPPMADKDQAFAYHLATRNFFAWIFRRSIVGEHLGSALIELLNSMAEFRGHNEDNFTDLTSYMDEEGYLDLKGQPHHALAILHLSECFQMRDMYIDAFSHCVGMSEELFCSPEYQHISSISRTLIRRARADMNNRLSQAGSMLKTFLEEELSETNLGLPAGGRAHLDRFRAFVLSHYMTRLGYYPPLSFDSRSTVFDPEIFEILRKDFKAVYDLLVDEGFTADDSSPLLAQGGICAVQSVQAFDERCDFPSLKHPLPLLPEIDDDKASRRMSLAWLANTARGDKLKPDQRLIAHAALIKAMNIRDTDMMDNEFVRAYRKFEEDSVAPHMKSDKTEKISPVDARKVRWILIYAVHQVLRNCTQPPPEVRDSVDVDYHLAVSTEQLPPWKNARGLKPLQSHKFTPNVTRSQSISHWNNPISPSLISPTTLVSPSIVIQPDIDYTAKARRDELSRRQSVAAAPTTPARSRSRSLSRNSPFRRTLSIFKKFEEENPAPRKASYCEIVVHGYGNGTNAVTKLAPRAVEQPEVSPNTLAPAPRSFSTSSESSAISEVSAGGVSFVTAESTAPPTSPESPDKNWPNQDSPMLSPIPLRGRRRVRDVLSFTGTPRASSSEWSPDRRHSVIGSGSYAHDYEELIKEQEAHFDRHELEPLPLQIRKASAPLTLEAMIAEDKDVQPEWEQFQDVGGLTSLSPLHI
ncbi:hypothetical protein CkaCkLH20_09508 [Colletotrichum karsti]|uniref:DUF8004 domain-containing protein n=1 Tax=Colletotrichum karsti TaxID=1095194 RepID=A0A9P6LGZ1_9PEZI|nr:uncharacterized protein CkaCkLH20_09508 [Colletotrichum karsti]KAF9872998.1 hypothetical protein CkaCkLH20_09508 [Colletotrichum karsti]